ncbi:glycine zipper 2TM domain-containing protein [Curvibacter sp. HBC28]|uniref:Glycine zipper 2TM domain-containing protein n=1 Tax=Curvibacter microcysteis TaxID=3026419 RepID=A0ABT5MCY2_9BURK|nr:glycine zipper 2TM domain-containing protein [Curvibacter sp. HBC28]MDD0814443.1 glycine zipper 2TM domain-containing protein [Curvibacter sp. HBC28]
MTSVSTHRAAWLAASVLFLGLSACSGMSGRQQDTAVGAGVGALGGAILTGGSGVGTVGGAAVGAVIGNEVGKDKK